MTLHVKHIYGEVGRDICLTRLSLEKMLIDREANKSWMFNLLLTLFNQNFVLINQFQKLVKDKAWKQIPQMLLSSETSSSYITSSFPFSFELELFTTLVTSKMAMSSISNMKKGLALFHPCHQLHSLRPLTSIEL